MSPTSIPTAHTPPQRHSSKGFTLVEVMIAILVIGLGLTSSAVCLRIGMLQQDAARATTYATQVLQDEAERIRLLNWAGLDNLPDLTTISPADALSVTGIDSSRFVFKREISEIANGIKQIHLLAEWNGHRGEPHSLSLYFQYAENGMHDYFYGVRL